MAADDASPPNDYYTTTHSESVSESPPVINIDHLADDVSYGSTGVRGLVSSPYVLAAAFLASLGGFSFGYDQVCRHATLFGQRR